MRTNAIQLSLLAVTFAALGACGSGQEAEVSSSTAGAPATDPAAGELAQTVDRDLYLVAWTP